MDLVRHRLPDVPRLYRFPLHLSDRLRIHGQSERHRIDRFSHLYRGCSLPHFQTVQSSSEVHEKALIIPIHKRRRNFHARLDLSKSRNHPHFPRSDRHLRAHRS